MMDGLAAGLWVIGIASLSISVFWQPDKRSHDEVLARRIAMMGFLYVALATLLSIQ